ncbi:MAG: RIP metalloprotease RseP [Deltaproteobacteria bacterium]|nr:RIP metalloprotease RseP [Deltaproteobacteria bacterium]
MTTAVSFLILIGVLIFIHELGHFIVAKAFNIKVTKFSLGFGPKLLSKKIGETEYILALLPLGGYVKLEGENPADIISEEDKKRSFSHQSVGKKALVVAAGPFFNFALAVLIFAGVYLAGIPVPTAEIGKIAQDSPAQVAGVRVGDSIVGIDDKKITAWDDVVAAITQADGSPMRIVLSRGDKTEITTITPKKEATRNVFGEETFIFRMGITPTDKVIVKRYNPFIAVWKGADKVVAVTQLTLLGIAKIFQGVVSPAESLGGPLAIAQMAGTQAKAGVLPFLLLMAFLSINLGIINLFPLPVLDGGHLLFYAIEAISGRPLHPRVMEMAHKIGFILLVALMVYVVFIDLNRANVNIADNLSRIFGK